MKKPNFERLAEVYGKILIKVVFEYELSEDPIQREKRKLEETWKAIKEYQKDNEGVEEIAKLFQYDDVPAIRDLCEEYQISSFYPDIRFIAFDYKKKYNSHNLHKRSEKIPESKYNEIELFSTLSMFQKYKNSLSLNLIRKQKVIGSIQNKELIDLMYSTLFEYFKENDSNIKLGIHPVEEINDWSEYFDLRIKSAKYDIKEFETSKKYIKSVVNEFIFILWTYLQFYTPLQAKEGSEYSNEQGRFIFKFLEIMEFIDKNKNISKKEDVIGYYLKSYKKTKPTRTIIKGTTYNMVKINAKNQYQIFKNTLADKQ